MLQVTVLGSGSRGNAFLIDGTESSLLVDAGFGTRTLARRLATAGRRPEQLSSVLLTHEHTDHSCGAVAACERWGWTLRGGAATIEAVRAEALAKRDVVDEPEASESDATRTRALRSAALPAEGRTRFDGWTVEAVMVPHDARECMAFVLTDESSGERVGIALDLGHVPKALPATFSGLDLLVVESNHDEKLLANGPYPWMLKRRIGGELGHLGNGAASAFIASCAHRGLRGVLLAHLSQTNNTPEHALSRTREALRRAGWRRDALYAAHQVTPYGPLSLDGRSRYEGATQLALGL
jgi:phosphoribosyl 1,2-cyclic phosphodiesterase